MVDQDILSSQVERLAAFIQENFPGEPSTPDGAIDVAMRLLFEARYNGNSLGVPAFIVKATDRFATETIRAHIRCCWREMLVSQADEETLALAEIIAWQKANPDKVHLPDHVHVPHSG